MVMIVGGDTSLSQSRQRDIGKVGLHWDLRHLRRPYWMYEILWKTIKKTYNSTHIFVLEYFYIVVCFLRGNWSLTSGRTAHFSVVNLSANSSALITVLLVHLIGKIAKNHLSRCCQNQNISNTWAAKSTYLPAHIAMCSDFSDNLLIRLSRYTVYPMYTQLYVQSQVLKWSPRWCLSGLARGPVTQL